MYKLSKELVGVIHQVLNELPAKSVRGILNKLDQELAPQVEKEEEKEEKKEDNKK